MSGYTTGFKNFKPAAITGKENISSFTKRKRAMTYNVARNTNLIWLVI